MQTKRTTRIAIAGIGGIGGYLGGKLAHYYAGKPGVEIIFICRGAHAEAISSKGLALLMDKETLICRPHLVAADPQVIGPVDVLILCTKQYGIHTLLTQYRSCITPQTTVVTTQNTVNGHETIAPFLPPGATLSEGCIYISAVITGAGTVQHKSGPSRLFFGNSDTADTRGADIAALLQAAGIDAVFTTSIRPVLWKKYIFVSPAAVVTALHNITFTQILENEDSKSLYVNLVAELLALARAKQVDSAEHTIANCCALLANFSPGVKSSFQLDLEQQRPTEMEALVLYAIQEAPKYGLAVPHYEASAAALKKMYPLSSRR